MKRRLGVPSPSMVVSVIALIVALGGTATAASVLIRSSSQIKNGAVTGADLRNGTVRSSDLRDRGVLGRDLRDGEITVRHLDGPLRETLAAATTSAREAFRKTGPESVEGNTSARVITMDGLEAGVYAIFAKVAVTVARSDDGILAAGESSYGHCVLNAAGDTDEARTLVGGASANSPGHMSMQITRTLGSPGTVTVDCDAGPTRWRASDSSVIAIRLGPAQRTPVSG